MREIDTLAIMGGGMKLVTAIGSLCVLEEEGILNNIKKYAGSSAGAIIVTLLNIGLTPLQIENTVFSQGSTLVKDSFYKLPFNLLFKYGLYNGNNMVKYIETLFIQKDISPNITFGELYEKTQKILVLTGTSLNAMDTFYFNYHTASNMKVIDALRISISIPLYFTCVEHIINGVAHIMCDGGVLQNFPIYYFDIVDNTGKYILNSNDLIKQKNIIKDLSVSSKTLGIMYLDSDEIKNVDDFYQGFNIINNISDYFIALLNTLLNKIAQDNFTNPITGAKENFFENIITITLPFNVSAVNFDLEKEKKDLLINVGRDAANKYFSLV